MVKKETKIKDEKEIKDVPKAYADKDVIVCERCGTWMIPIGGGPLGSKDYECSKCHAKMTKGG